MKKNFRRVAAYFIDIVIVTVLVSLLTSNDKTNFQYNNYQKYYKEYTEVAAKYEKVISKQLKLETKKATKKISNKQYKNQNKELSVSKKKCEKKIKKLQFLLTRNLVIQYLFNIAIILGYFGIFQASFNGQTLGKRLMKIKVVKTDGGSGSIIKMLLRAFVLHKVWLLVAYIVLAYTLSQNSFFIPYQILTNIGNYFQFIILLMIVITKSNRGLHDYIAGTKVIDISNSEILEAEVTEKKGE